MLITALLAHQCTSSPSISAQVDLLPGLLLLNALYQKQGAVII